MKEKKVCIRANYLWDGKTEEPIRNGLVIIQGNRICETGPAESVHVPDDMEETLFKEATILPGLIDGHTHLNYLGIGMEAHEYVNTQTRAIMISNGIDNLRRSLETGVTTLWDDGAKDDTALYLRRKIREGELFGSDIYSCKVAIKRANTPDGSNMGGEIDPDDPRAAASFVHDLIEKDHVDFIKLMLNGGGVPGSGGYVKTFPDKTVKAMIDETHAMGKKTAAHCITNESIRQYIECGGDLVVHGEFIDNRGEQYVDPYTFDLLADSGIWLNPTVHTSRSKMMAYHKKAQISPLTSDQQHVLDRVTEHFTNRIRTVYELWQRGVRMVAGSDAGYAYYPFGGFYHELAALNYAGIPVGEVLKMGTSNTAEFMGRHDEIGSLQSNSNADILVCKGNVFNDIYALKDVIAVYKNGKRVV